MPKPQEKEKKADEKFKEIERLKQYRSKFEARFFIASAFYDGFHFSWGKQDKDGKWLEAPTPKGKVLRQVPKAKKHINKMRDMLMKVSLRPVVYPDRNVIYGVDNLGEDQGKLEQEKENALKMGSFVEYQMMEVMKLLTHRKKLINKAQLMSHSFMMIEDDVNGNKKLEVYDAFEISCPFGIHRIDDVIVKHVTISYDKLLSKAENKESHYDLKAVKKLKENMEGKYSESQYKDSMLSDKFGKANERNIIMDELYKKDPDRDHKITIYTYVKEDLVATQETELTKIPASVFVWNIGTYETSLMEDFIPLNRSYDTFVSKLEHKVKKMDTTRMLVQKREAIKTMTSSDGEIIRYKRVKPDIIPEATLSNAYSAIIQIIEGDMKEQGVAIASGADLPSGVSAWRAIEALKASDYESIGNQIDNYIEFLTDLTEKLVDMIAADQAEEVVEIPKGGGDSEAFKIVGKSIFEERENKDQIPDGLIVVDPNRTIRIEMENNAGWTEAGRRDLIIELVGADLMPKETAVELMKVGNTREIIKQMEIEMTKGHSIIDMPEFKLLPVEIQQAIVQYLQQGGIINDPDATPEDIAAVEQQGKEQ